MADKKTKQIGIPPKVRAKFEEKGFYDNPTKSKNSSDTRIGDLPLVFNDSTNNVDLITGQKVNFGPNSSILIAQDSNEFQTLNYRREQDYNNGGLIVSSDRLNPPYKDSQQYALEYFTNTNSIEYSLLASSSNDVGNFVKQPVWSKSKFEVNLPSTMVTPVTFSISQSTPLWIMPWHGGISSSQYFTSSVTRNHLTGALGRSYPMLYYNFDLKTWEPIGKGWTLCCSIIQNPFGKLDPMTSPGYVGSHDHATIGFSPSILNYFEGLQKFRVEGQYANVSHSFYGMSASAITGSDFYPRWLIANTASMQHFPCTTWEEGLTAGHPIDDFGFPFAAKYHATSSQVLKLKNYIKKPFAVERIAVHFDNVEYTVFDTVKPLVGSTTGSTLLKDMITPSAINNFFILNQRTNQKLDSTLLLASLYSSLYEGIYKAIDKSLNAYANKGWTDPPTQTAYNNDYKRYKNEFLDTFSKIGLNIIQYYFGKLPLQLTLPQKISLTYNDILTSNLTNVDTIREIITYGGITSKTTDFNETNIFSRSFTTLKETITNNNLYGQNAYVFYNSLITSGYTHAQAMDFLAVYGQNYGTTAPLPVEIGLSSPWVRTIPLYKYLLDITKGKFTDARETTTIYTKQEVITKLVNFVPGLTTNQAKILADSFQVSKGFLNAPTNTTFWNSQEWINKFDEVFSNSIWQQPLTQSALAFNAFKRETFVETGLSFESSRLPALSFSKSIHIILPTKNPSSTKNIDLDSFLWQPNNPADIQPVFCTSTHASFELGGRNGLGMLHSTDREPEAGNKQANTVLNNELEYSGIMFGNVADGEVEEQGFYGKNAGMIFGYPTPVIGNYNGVSSYLAPLISGSNVFNVGTSINQLAQILNDYNYQVATSTIFHGQYYVQSRKLWDRSKNLLAEITNSVSKSDSVFREYQKALYSDTPYLLFPEDNLIFGWQQPIPRDVTFCNWTSQSYFPTSITSSVPQPGIVDISCIRLGNARIVFYGSEISEGKEYHDTLNQYLTSADVYETIE